MSSTQASLKKYNLIDVLSREIEVDEAETTKKYQLSGIRIPMIQRDYAQGRKEEGEVRKRFLNAIFDALNAGEKLELDFVYGSIATIDDQQFFVPLDGQQRLTTLFLLYWYIGNRELEGEELASLRAVLSRFSYETRVSARDFCEKLSRTSLSFAVKPGQEISKAIWFYDLYRNDPTVASMLRMLDGIHERYEGSSKNLFGNLINLAFYVLPLGGFSLTDELYIKMNARGKALTHFENFKADLINWFQHRDNPHNEDFDLETEYHSRRMPYHMSFALKMDNEWTNLFWHYSKSNANPDDKIVDAYFLNFWNRYLLHEFITQSPLGQDAIVSEELFVKFSTPASEISYDGFEDYKRVLEKGDTVRRLQRLLDQLVKHQAEIATLIQPAWSQADTWWLFNKEISQRQRILFLAITRYLELSDFDPVMFRNWMRVVWNIIVDPDIRSIEATVSIIRLIDRLSAGAGDIYKYLSGKDMLAAIGTERTFAKSQLEEERLKAGLILSDDEWEPLLVSAEGLGLFQGNIGFALAGEHTKATFAHRLSIAADMFNDKGPAGIFKDGHLLMRAVIATIPTWEGLSSISFADKDANWQLLLRRNATVRSAIRIFCDIRTIEAAADFMEDLVRKNSSIAGWSQEVEVTSKVRLVHEHLYKDAVFHSCLQDAGAVALKSHKDHIYVHRPRAWYDLVMLDTFRNELGLGMVEMLGFQTQHRFRNSNYFYGDIIPMVKPYQQYKVVAQFDAVDTLTVGVKDDRQGAIDTPSSGWFENAEGWQVYKTYDYGAVRSNADVLSLLKQIEMHLAERE